MMKKTVDVENDLSFQCLKLIEQQLNDWPMAANNYAALQFIEEKTFDFEDCRIKILFNPGRAVSSNAKVDKQSILERPCFLCSKNLPTEQKCLFLSEDFPVLLNPFPIFYPHLTIPHINHIPQQISSFFGEMLKMAKILSDYTIFYNGPRCGASAPDHLHFQAISKGIMPAESESFSYTENIHRSEEGYSLIKDELRTYFLIEGENEDVVESAFKTIYDKLPQEESEEPMMNVLSAFTDNKFRTLVFPRKQHRPQQYFAENEKQIQISPGAVDMAGVLITSRKEDFDKLTKSDIKSIFKQVGMNVTTAGKF